MVRNGLQSALVFAAVLAAGNFCWAHFGMVIPSDSMVMQSDDRTVTVTASFSHPFEMIGMDLEKPKAFFVVANGEKQNLRSALQKTTVMDHTAWKTDYRIRRPGVYMFAMEPAPYWEPAEDVFIVHYTKTVVTAFGDDEGWDRELGLKTEIVPLSKPYGLYAGNVFQGIVELERQACRSTRRLHGHPDHQGRRQRRVHLCSPEGGLVGLCGTERSRFHPDPRRPGKGGGDRGGHLGAF